MPTPNAPIQPATVRTTPWAMGDDDASAPEGWREIRRRETRTGEFILPWVVATIATQQPANDLTPEPASTGERTPTARRRRQSHSRLRGIVPCRGASQTRPRRPATDCSR